MPFMPCGSFAVTFFKDFVKITNRSNPMWAIGHVGDLIAMTWFKETVELPTIDDIPNNMVEITSPKRSSVFTDFDMYRYNGPEWARIIGLDIDKYLELKDMIKQHQDTVPYHVMNRTKGIIMGHAIGDALGANLECLSKQAIAEKFSSNLGSDKQNKTQNWRPESWTNDTEQMICVLDSLLEKQAINTQDIAKKLHRCVMSDPMGVGRTVHTATQTSGFLKNPPTVAQKIWEASGKQWAGNGALMRSSALGIWEFRRYGELAINQADASRAPFYRQAAINAADVSRITHYDPRCVDSCAVFCDALATILDRQYVDLDLLLKRAVNPRYSLAPEIHPQLKIYIEKAIQSEPLSDLNALELDKGLIDEKDKQSFSYTLKTLGVAFWALRHASSFEEGLLQIILEGGDTNTNGAVAGAMLGAKFGYTAIPQEWIDSLTEHEMLEEKAEQLVNLAYSQKN